jgi:uncharacterized protein involved in exopolysaccharide biosynthesis
VDSDSYGARLQDEGIDLVVISQVVKRYKFFIALCTVVCAVAATVYALTATPMYRADVTVAEAHNSNMGSGAAGIASQLGGLASLAGVTLGPASGPSRDAEAILKSRRLVQQFIERYNLTETLLSRTKEPRDLWHAVAFFRKKVLNVDEDRRNGVTTISMYWRDPKQAALWANDFVALGNEIIANRAAADARRNIGYLNEQLKQTGSVEVQHAMYNLIESEMKTLMLAQGRAEYAFSTIDPAVPPELSTSPKTAVIILIGIVVGIFAGVLIGIARYKVARSRDRLVRGSLGPA